MSPEYLNRGIISKELDIFSLGVIIIEIITGDKNYPDKVETSSQEFIELVSILCFYFPGGCPLFKRYDIKFSLCIAVLTF
jgi:serine/threonine protein kinase